MRRTSVALEPEQFAWLVADAQRHERTVSQSIRRLINQAIEDDLKADLAASVGRA
jgi:hypothetical protein